VNDPIISAVKSVHIKKACETIDDVVTDTLINLISSISGLNGGRTNSKVFNDVPVVN
jgi:hypothetical protein